MLLSVSAVWSAASAGASAAYSQVHDTAKRLCDFGLWVCLNENIADLLVAGFTTFMAGTVT